MKKLFLISIIASILISLITCSKKDNKISSGKIQFSVNAKISSAKKSALIVSTAKSILVSIEDSTGKVFYDSENVELYNFNGIYTSKPLPLKTGFYKLTKFMVVDSAGNVIYAAPKKGSPKAYLVQNPLDIDFSIEEDVVTKLAPEVLSTEESTPADFGYFDATFVIVKTFDFLISIFAYDQTTRNFKLTDASITISDSIKELYTLQLGAKTNKITVNDGLSIYNLRITKNGYSAITKSFTSDSLKACFNKPLVIVLISSSVNINNGLVAYYPFNGNANDESGNGNNGTVYGATLTQDKYGNANKAYYFDGIDNKIGLPVSTIGNWDQLTIFVIVKPVKYVDTRWPDFVCGYTDDKNLNIALGIWRGTSHMHIEVDTYSGNFPMEGQLNIPWDEWFTATLVYNGISLTEYLNGVKGKSIPATGNLKTLECLNVGYTNDVNPYFNGYIDEIRIYKRALNEEEINALMNK